MNCQYCPCLCNLVHIVVLIFSCLFLWDDLEKNLDYNRCLIQSLFFLFSFALILRSPTLKGGLLVSHLLLPHCMHNSTMMLHLQDWLYPVWQQEDVVNSSNERCHDSCHLCHPSYLCRSQCYRMSDRAIDLWRASSWGILSDPCLLGLVAELMSASRDGFILPMKLLLVS
jgi:hypothetical protein